MTPDYNHHIDHCHKQLKNYLGMSDWGQHMDRNLESDSSNL